MLTWHVYPPTYPHTCVRRTPWKACSAPAQRGKEKAVNELEKRWRGHTSVTALIMGHALHIMCQRCIRLLRASAHPAS